MIPWYTAFVIVETFLASPITRTNGAPFLRASTTSVLPLCPRAQITVWLPPSAHCHLYPCSGHHLQLLLLRDILHGHEHISQFLLTAADGDAHWHLSQFIPHFDQVYFFPSIPKWMAHSQPARPPPITATLSATLSWFLYSSLTMITFSPLIPGIGGTSGLEPTAMIRASGCLFFHIFRGHFTA